MNCGCPKDYECPLCHRCYQCEHKAILTAKQWHWICPNGTKHWTEMSGRVHILTEEANEA